MLLTYYHHHYFIPEFMKISGTLPHAKLLTPKVKSEQRVPHTPTKQPPTAAGCSHRSKTALNAVRRNLFGHPLSKDEEIYRCEQVATDPSRNSSVEGNLAFYFDLHGHVSKAGCFLYGNHLKPIQQVKTD